MFLFLLHLTDPIIVHCSAGVGRTGTFITIHEMISEIMKIAEGEKRSKHEVNVLKRVLDLRKERIGMVQTVEQYLFIHIALDTFFQAKFEG